MDPAEAPAEQPLSRWENLRQGETYAPNPFLAEITADGVNLSHLRSNPTLTPAERIRRMAASVAWSRSSAVVLYAAVARMSPTACC